MKSVLCTLSKEGVALRGRGVKKLLPSENNFDAGFFAKIFPCYHARGSVFTVLASLYFGGQVRSTQTSL
jgi:hypothetical protein